MSSSLLLLALLVGTPAADDTTSLLQASVGVHRRGLSPLNATGSCDCLGWQDAYTSYGAQCGSGHELDLLPFPVALARHIPGLSEEICHHFFGSLPNDPRCLKRAFDASEDNWCYVPGACAEGQATDRQGLGVKSCHRGRDTLVSDMRFEDFAAYAYRSRMEMGIMTQFTYPTWGPEKLPDVQAFWGLEAPSNAAPISDELRQRLQAMVDSGNTTFFTSVSGHPPYAVAEGTKLFYINFRTAGVVDFNHKEDMNRYACVAGCEHNAPLW